MHHRVLLLVTRASLPVTLSLSALTRPAILTNLLDLAFVLGCVFALRLRDLPLMVVHLLLCFLLDHGLQH